MDSPYLESALLVSGNFNRASSIVGSDNRLADFMLRYVIHFDICICWGDGVYLWSGVAGLMRSFWKRTLKLNIALLVTFYARLARKGNIGDTNRFGQIYSSIRV